jgi:hypothetical protein
MIINRGKTHIAVQAITMRHPNTFAPNISIIFNRFCWVLNSERSEKNIPVLESKHTININDRNAGTP